MLDLAAPGVAPPKGVEGGSWKSVLENDGGKVKRPIDRLVFHQAVEVDHPQSAIRQGDFKLLYYWDTHEYQLYNIANDLGRTPQPRRERPDLTSRLGRELKDHVRAGLGESAFAALERSKPGQNPQTKAAEETKGTRASLNAASRNRPAARKPAQFQNK